MAKTKAPDKGTLLNRRVGRLFERAGFAAMPNSNSEAEHVITIDGKSRPLDLWAEEATLKVKIAGSNKSGQIQGGFGNHLTHLEKVRSLSKSDACLLVLTAIEPDMNDLQAAESAGVSIWTEKHLLYYEALADAIGHYAKYEIISSLGIETQESKKSISISALRIRQPDANNGSPLYLFSMTAEDLLKTCVVCRRANLDADAYQRMVTKKRLPGIRKFVSRPDAILPTNVVVAFNPDSVVVLDLQKIKPKQQGGQPITFTHPSHEAVALTIPLAYGSMELLDGQHRLFGFALSDFLTRDNFHLAVTGVEGLSTGRKRDTFVAINDNARRMDPNLVAYLKYEPNDSICQKNPSIMAIRVAVDMHKRNPFKNKIRLLDMGKQVLTLKGLSGYDLKGLLGSQGALRKTFPSNLPNDYVSYLSKYFSLLRSQFSIEWDDPKTYIIATNRGISAFLKLLKAILINESFNVDADAAKKYFAALSKFEWESSKLKANYVGSQGWRGFYLDLVKEIRKTYPKFKP